MSSFQAPRCPVCGLLLPERGLCPTCGWQGGPAPGARLAEGERWGVEGDPYAADLMLEGDLFSG